MGSELTQSPPPSSWWPIDPYRTCVWECHHDLPRGVLVEQELMAGDGPDRRPVYLVGDIGGEGAERLRQEVDRLEDAARKAAAKLRR